MLSSLVWLLWSQQPRSGASLAAALLPASSQDCGVAPESPTFGILASCSAVSATPLERRKRAASGGCCVVWAAASSLPVSLLLPGLTPLQPWPLLLPEGHLAEHLLFP